MSPLQFFPRILLLVISLTAFVTSYANAQSTLLPLSDNRGMVFDHAGKYLYITRANQSVDRYNIATGQVDVTYPIGADIYGLDISPDDSYLLITDDPEFDPPVSRIHKLDLPTGTVTHIDVANYGYGTITVAIASNNRAFVTTYLGSPLLQIDLTTNAVTERTDAPGTGSSSTDNHSWTRIYRSPNGQRLFFLGNQWNHVTFTYDALTDRFGAGTAADQEEEYCVGAVNRDGTMLGTSFNVFRAASHISLDTASDLRPLRAFPNAGGGVAFHPTQDIVFGVDNFSNEVVAYDTNTYVELFRGPSGDEFFQTPLFISGDGRLLAWKTLGGIRLFNLPTSFSIPSPKTPSLANVQRVVFDGSSKYLYAATSDGMVYRYDYTVGVIDRSYSLGGSLRGMDVAPDDSVLLVGQAYVGLARGVCHKIDLRSGEVSNILYPRILTYDPKGVVGVAIASNGKAFLGADGGPWEIDLASNDVSTRHTAGMSANPDIMHSADRSRLYFAFAQLTPNSSTGGNFQVYDCGSDSFFPSLILTNRAFDNPAYAIDRHGVLVATKHGDHVAIDTASGFDYVHTLSGVDGGIVFDVGNDRLYAVDSRLDRIIAWDTVQFAQTFELQIGEDIAPLSSSFGPGNLVASPDGRSLAVITPTTVRVLQIPASPSPRPTPPPQLGTARDLVFDHAGKYLYISTAEGQVQRYNIQTSTLDASYSVGGFLNAIDIAPDDSALYVAQGTAGLAHGAICKIDLRTGNQTALGYELSDYETGAWDLAIGANGLALFSGQEEGYGWQPLRQIEISTDTISIRTDSHGSGRNGWVVNGTQIRRNGDRTKFYLSDDPVFTYDAVSNAFGPNFGQSLGMGNASMAINRSGTIAATRYRQDIIFQSLPNFASLYTFKNFDVGSSGYAVSGIAFDAVKDLLYGVNTNSNRIVAYDSNTYALKHFFDVGDNIEPSQNSRFGVGNLTASQDGRWLGLITPTAVRVYNVANGEPPPPQMFSPEPGSTLDSSTVTFRWSPGGAGSILLIGSSQRGSDIYNSTQLHTFSATVNQIPTDGRSIYVTLGSQVGGQWITQNFTYTAQNVSPSPTPTPSSTPSATPTPTPSATPPSGQVVETPIISPAGGTFRKSVTVKMSCATSGAAIHYTMDGSDPTSGSPVYSSSKKFKGIKLTGKGSHTVKAIGTKSGSSDSAIATATFTIN